MRGFGLSGLLAVVMGEGTFAFPRYYVSSPFTGGAPKSVQGLLRPQKRLYCLVRACKPPYGIT